MYRVRQSDIHSFGYKLVYGKSGDQLLESGEQGSVLASSLIFIGAHVHIE